MKDPIIIGRIGRVFGIKGWLNVISFTDPKENILLYEPWWVFLDKKQEDGWKIVHVTHHIQDVKGIRVKIESFDSPEEAQSLVNKEIAIMQDQLPALNSDQYYWSQLEGLLVKNTQNIVLGVVDHLFETGSNDVMVIKGDKKHYIPFLMHSTVLQVDLENKFILVDWDADF